MALTVKLTEDALSSQVQGYGYMSMYRHILSTCKHGTKARGSNCSSDQSWATLPVFLDQIRASSPYRPHSQLMCDYPVLCHAYMYHIAIEYLASRSMAYSDSEIAMTPVGTYSKSSHVIASLGDKLRPSSGPQDCHNGMLVFRGYQSMARSVLPDELELKTIAEWVTPPDWWIIPVTTDEIHSHISALPSWALKSRVVLPVASGPDCRYLCLVGYTDEASSLMREYTSLAGKLGWYNSRIRPMRIMPGVCHDCIVARDAVA